MAGTLALTKAELSRLMHNRRYFIFTVAFPVILYLLIGRQVSAHAYGIAFGAYYMISMATFGAFSGALNGNAQRISQEKKEGWIRQLRLTPLPASAYVVAKVLVSLATTIPAIVIVLLLGRFYGNVHLPAWEWPVSYSGWETPEPPDYDPADEARRQLDKAISAVLTPGDATEARRTVIEGNPAPVLEALSKTADLIVIGSHGHGEFAGMLLGSVSRGVVERTDGCVTVVPTGTRWHPDPYAGPPMLSHMEAAP